MARVEMMGLDPANAIEIEIAGPDAVMLQQELVEQLSLVEGLEACPYVRKGLDFPQLIYLAGALGGIVQGLDTLWRWYASRRQSSEAIRLIIRRKNGGELDLRAHTEDEAYTLLTRMKQILERGDSS